MPKNAQITTKTIVDSETGEVKKMEHIATINYGSEPNFVKLYLGEILYLQDMPEGISAVMYCILQRIPYMDEEDQSVILSKDVKEMIAKKLNKSYQYVANSIVQLVKGKLLFHKGSKRSARYVINPFIFGKGSWQDVKKSQILLGYDFEHHQKTFWLEVESANKGGSVIDLMYAHKNDNLKSGSEN